MNEAKSVSHRFFTDLMEDYIRNKEASFLFSYFKEDYEKKIKEGGNNRKKTGSKTGIDGVKKTSAKRTGFYEELAYQYLEYEKERLTKVEYISWLVNYLVLHDKYFKDQNGVVGHECLFPLLTKVLLIKPDQLWKDREYLIPKRTKTEVSGDLKQLAELLPDHINNGGQEVLQECSNEEQRKIRKASVVERIEKLSHREIASLTDSLKRMAVHIKVKTYLQDSGYPVVEMKGKGKLAIKPPRKQDLTMQLFSAFCASEQGYSIQKKNRYETNAVIQKVGMHGKTIKNNYYYLQDNQKNEITNLWKTLRRSGNKTVFIPLAIDLLTGCVFALVGKENYRYLYEEEEKRIKKEESEIRTRKYGDAKRVAYLGKKEEEIAKYKKSKDSCCFDFLRFQQENFESRMEIIVDVETPLQVGPYTLQANFHLYEGLDYDTMLDKFKNYCATGDEGGEYVAIDPEDAPRNIVREMNDIMPYGVSEAFRFLFAEEEDDVEENMRLRERDTMFQSLTNVGSTKKRLSRNLENQVLTK